MLKISKYFYLSLLIITFVFSVFGQINSAQAQANLPEINFFYTDTCPHCADQKEFHKYLLNKYPDLIINSYNISNRKTVPILQELAKQYDAEQYIGLVPLTFIGEAFIVGFNTPETTGASIELALIKNDPGLLAKAEFCDDEETQLCIADLENTDLFGEGNQIVDSGSYTILNQSSKLSAFGLDAEKLSLPILSIVLGFLDGFNICSLGALMLILSLVLTFKSRKKVFLFGGIFLIITGITYAALIFAWFYLFKFLAPISYLLEIIIGSIGLFGGIIFLRQYFRYKKYGPTCEMSDSPLINKVTQKLKKVFTNPKNIFLTIVAVIAFAFTVTIIEFPCSAVIPVAFAAILAELGVGVGAKIFYIGLFMIFYLLDELIIFLIGVFTLRIWFGGQNMVTRLTLFQAILFIAIGLFYFWRIVS